MTTKTHDEMRAELIGRAGKDAGFRAQLLDDPKAAIKDALGIDVPESLSLTVHEDTAMAAHLVLPPMARLSDDDLAGVAAGHRMSRSAYDRSALPHIHP